MLTPREKQVLELLAMGKPHSAIANQLGVSVERVCQIVARSLMMAKYYSDYYDLHSSCREIAQRPKIERGEGKEF